MSRSKFLRKFGLYAITAILTIGIIIAFGILSASGMLLFSPSVGLAIAAFIFGGVVEGEVFKQEIMDGIQDLKLLGNKGYRYLVTQALEQHIQQLKASSSLQGFLLEYDELQTFVASLQDKKLSASQQLDKAQARKRLRAMQTLLTQYVLEENSEDNYLRDVIALLRAHRRLFSIKMVIYRMTLFLSIACGIGFGFAVASVLPAALFAVSASLVFLVWPLAVIAAIGYTFLIFHTVKDLLLSDTFSRWKENVKNWFRLEDGKVTVKYVLKIACLAVVTAALIALCVVATLATAGTWWIAVKNGANLIPALQRVSGVIRNILTPLLAAGDFVFSLFNSIAALNLVINAIYTAKPIQSLQKMWGVLSSHENLLQIINPFRMIYLCIQKTIDLVLLIGHTLATGVARDQFLNVPPAVLAGAGAAREFCADTPFFFEEDKESLTQKIILWLLSPLVALSALWQFGASQFNSVNGKPKLEFVACLKDAFKLRDQDTVPAMQIPDMSPAWRQFSIEREFAGEIRRLRGATIQSSLAQQKCTALLSIQKSLLNNDKVANHDQAIAVLKLPRFFATQPQETRSSLFAAGMLTKYQSPP